MSYFYALVADVKKAKQLIKILKKMKVPGKNIKLLAESKDHREMSQLLDASIEETTDLVPSLIRGALIGGIIGLITSLMTIHFFSEYFPMIGGGTILGLSLLSMLLGAWASSLIGVSVINPTLKSFETALDRGEIIVQIDVSKQKGQNLLKLIKVKYPDILLQNLPPFE